MRKIDSKHKYNFGGFEYTIIAVDNSHWYLVRAPRGKNVYYIENTTKKLNKMWDPNALPVLLQPPINKKELYEERL